jgi:hypothetical protein
MPLQTLAESVSPPDVVNGRAIHIKFLVSKSHFVSFDSDTDTDPDPDPDSEPTWWPQGQASTFNVTVQVKTTAEGCVDLVPS